MAHAYEDPEIEAFPAGTALPAACPHACRLRTAIDGLSAAREGMARKGGELTESQKELKAEREKAQMAQMLGGDAKTFKMQTDDSYDKARDSKMYSGLLSFDELKKRKVFREARCYPLFVCCACVRARCVGGVMGGGGRDCVCVWVCV